MVITKQEKLSILKYHTQPSRTLVMPSFKLSLTGWFNNNRKAIAMREKCYIALRDKVHENFTTTYSYYLFISLENFHSGKVTL